MERDEPEGDDPKGVGPDKGPGRKLRGGRPPQSATERVERDPEAGRWGDLPPYLQMLFRKRGMPKLPDKYRRLRDAFHKQADRKPRKR